MILNLPNSENSRLHRDGNTFPNQSHIIKTAGFRFLLTKTRFSSKFASLSEFCKLKREPLQTQPNLLLFEAECSVGLPNHSHMSKPAKHAVFGIWDSIKHEFRVCQVYRKIYNQRTKYGKRFYDTRIHGNPANLTFNIEIQTNITCKYYKLHITNSKIANSTNK